MGLERGRLIRRGGAAIDIEFSAEGAPIGGEPAYLTLHGLDQPLEDDELVVVQGERRTYSCRVLDSTNVCAITHSSDVGGEVQTKSAAQDPHPREPSVRKRGAGR